MLVRAIMRAVKRVNLDVATHAVTGGTLINQSIFCSSFFMNGRRSLSFAIVHAVPCRFSEVFFSKIKKLDTLSSVTAILLLAEAS